MLRRLLQIREGESTRTVLLFAYLFLVVTSYVVTKSTRDALFLDRYSAASLPYADIAAAVSVAGVMAIYLRLGRAVGVRSVLIGTLMAFSSTSLGFWALSRSSEPFWMLPVLYVWAGVFGVLLPAQVWTLANRVMTTREAKRLFGVIGSGAICGWIAGGLMTKFFATRFGTESLLLMTSVALAICPLMVVAIWREGQSDPHDEPATTSSSPGQPRGLKDSIELVWRSPHLRAIAALVCCSSLVTTIAAWQFRAIAKHAIPETNALTAFFGTFNVYAGMLSLATQLFLTSRLLRRFGLGVALFIVPVALTAGSMGVLFWGGIGAAVFLKGSDQVLRYSIDRSTVELLYLPVPERQIFYAKACIDTIVWRVGDCLGAGLILIGVVLLGMTPSQVSIVTVILLAGWMAAAAAARREYVQNLRSSIYEHRIDTERLSSVVLDRATSDVLMDALTADDPQDILYALTLFTGADLPAAREPVYALLGHRSPAVRARAIAVLGAANDVAVLPQVEHLIQDDDQTVRSEALLYLTRFTDIDPLTRLSDLNQVQGTSVASAIAAFLARPGPAQNVDAVRMLLDAALTRAGAEGEQARVEAARLIGTLPDGFLPQLQILLKDPAPAVVREAMRAAGALGDPTTLELIVDRLGEASVLLDATEALSLLGDKATACLGRALSDDTRAPELRRAIPDVLQRIGTPNAEQLLVENLLEPDPSLRLRTVSALNKVRQLNPDRRLERELVETVLAAEILGHYRSYQILGALLANAGNPDAAARTPLNESMMRELERIFRLMALLFPGNDLHSAYVGLRSANADVHANALELLEHTLPTHVRRLLLPLIDNEVSIAERIKLANEIVGAALDRPERAMAAAAAEEELLREAARKTGLRAADSVNADRPGGRG
jgi:ATP:ADP antiporter, AAA family